jgi:hypothetical protein
LHTWGSTLILHPHAAHIIVPGGGFSPKPAPAQAGGRALDCLPTQILSVDPSALTSLPPPVPGKADRRPPGKPGAGSSATADHIPIGDDNNKVRARFDRNEAGNPVELTNPNFQNEPFQSEPDRGD